MICYRLFASELRLEKSGMEYVSGAAFRLVVSLQLSLLCMYVKGNIPQEKIPLNFSYITTKTGGFVSSGSIPVVDLALEQINNRTDILSNYTLNYTVILDSKVSH